MQTHIKDIYTILKNDATLKGYLIGTTTDSKIYPAISDKFESFPCITYEVVVGYYRTKPTNTQDITLQLRIFTRNDKQLLENIYSRINNLLNYYQDTNRLVYLKQTLESDQNETDRQLYTKVLRYQVWSRDI